MLNQNTALDPNDTPAYQEETELLVSFLEDANKFSGDKMRLLDFVGKVVRIADSLGIEGEVPAVIKGETTIRTIAGSEILKSFMLAKGLNDDDHAENNLLQKPDLLADVKVVISMMVGRRPNMLRGVSTVGAAFAARASDLRRERGLLQPAAT